MGGSFRLMQIKASSSEQLNRLLEVLPNMDVLHLDQRNLTVVGVSSPQYARRVSMVTADHQSVFEVLHNNVQEVVDEEFRQIDERSRRIRRSGNSLRDSTKRFISLSQIYHFQNRVRSSCRKHAQVVKKVIGYSTYRRPIRVMKISKFGSKAKKDTIFIESGVHAREWLSPATANYIIYQLACNKKNADMLQLFNWHIVSVSNPDGYSFSFTKGNRLWRKNRQRTAGSKCVGTDLNRNFAEGFGKRGSSADPCSQTYRGTRPYSAPESLALRTHVMTNKKSMVTYLSLHTFGQLILLPWGYKPDRPSNMSQLIHLAKVAERAMRTPFKIGPTYSAIYPAAGIAPDFARARAGIARAYTWELMPSSGKLGGFILEEATISRHTAVIWRGLRAYAKALNIQLKK